MAQNKAKAAVAEIAEIQQEAITSDQRADYRAAVGSIFDMIENIAKAKSPNTKAGDKLAKPRQMIARDDVIDTLIESNVAPNAFNRALYDVTHTFDVMPLCVPNMPISSRAVFNENARLMFATAMNIRAAVGESAMLYERDVWRMFKVSGNAPMTFGTQENEPSLIAPKFGLLDEKSYSPQRNNTAAIFETFGLLVPFGKHAWQIKAPNEAMRRYAAKVGITINEPVAA